MPDEDAVDRECFDHAIAAESETFHRYIEGTWLNSRVSLPGIEEKGEVRRIRYDDADQPIFTVDLDNATATPDGLMYARLCELVRL